MPSTRLALGLIPAMAIAHTGEPLQPHDLWNAWRFEPGVIAPLAIAAILYLRGARHCASPLQRLCFWAGWMALAGALVSPLHSLGEVLFSAHMAQHEILMLVAAPLLVWSRPMAALLWGMPAGWRRPVGKWSKVLLVGPLAAWVIHAIALWVWHVPALFQSTLTSEWAHTAQHLTFLISALMFWWALWFAHGRAGYGAGMLYVFTTAAHTGVLGALLTLSPSLWYPAYAANTAAWGMSPLQDQQFGGLIMWVPAGVVYLAAGLVLCAAWLKESDAMAARRIGLFTITIVAVLLSRCAASPEAARGARQIARYGCGTCHTISGVAGAHGLVGPPLDGLSSRMYIAGVLTNNTANFVRWVQDPKAVDEKTAMPTLGVTAADANDIAAFIYSKH